MRKKIWPYLLGVLPWDMSKDDRAGHWKEKKQLYDDTYSQWFDVDAVFNRDDIIEVIIVSGVLYEIDLFYRNDTVLMWIAVERIVLIRCSPPVLIQ